MSPCTSDHRFPAAATLLALACAAACTPDTPATDLAPDAALDEIMADGFLPGVAVGVMQDGKVTYSAVRGVRRRGDPAPLQLDDVFHIGSNTKAMTSMLVATYVDEGKLHWTDTIDGLLQGVVDYRAEYASVTLEQLLSHSSGLSDATFTMDDLRPYYSTGKPVTDDRRMLATKALSLAPASTPGTKYEYANANYVIVGVVLEHLTGRPWEELLQERIFTPLGLKSAGFGVPGTPGKVDAPWGHGPAPVEPGPTSDLPAVLGPAGLVHANLADLETYFGLYFTKGRLSDGRQLVSEASMAELVKPRLGTGAFQYGLGWGIKDDADGRLIAHGGSNLRFMAYFVLRPERGNALIILTNIGADGLTNLGLDDVGAHVKPLSEYLRAHFKL